MPAVQDAVRIHPARLPAQRVQVRLLHSASVDDTNVCNMMGNITPAALQQQCMSALIYHMSSGASRQTLTTDALSTLVLVAQAQVGGTAGCRHRQPARRGGGGPDPPAAAAARQLPLAVQVLTCSPERCKVPRAELNCTGSLSGRVQGPTRSSGISACQSMYQRQQQRHIAVGSPLDLPLLPACSTSGASSGSSGCGNGAAVLTAAQAARPETALWLRRELEALMLESDVGMVRGHRQPFAYWRVLCRLFLTWAKPLHLQLSGTATEALRFCTGTGVTCQRRLWPPALRRLWRT